MSKPVFDNKWSTETVGSRLSVCCNCGAPVYRWPAAWSIERYCEDSSLSRAYVYQKISSKELELRKAGSRSLILFEIGWSFLHQLPVFEPGFSKFESAGGQK